MKYCMQNRLVFATRWYKITVIWSHAHLQKFWIWMIHGDSKSIVKRSGLRSKDDASKHFLPNIGRLWLEGSFYQRGLRCRPCWKKLHGPPERVSCRSKGRIHSKSCKEALRKNRTHFIRHSDTVLTEAFDKCKRIIIEKVYKHESWDIFVVYV